MLANDRFNWETPNVIDPGEKAPSRPNRERLSISESNQSGSPPSSSTASSAGTNASYKPRISTILSNRQKISLDGVDYSDEDSWQQEQRRSSSLSLSDVSQDRLMDDEEYGGDLDKDLDDLYCITSTSPGNAEQARLFAENILKESDRKFVSPFPSPKYRTVSDSNADAYRRRRGPYQMSSPRCNFMVKTVVLSIATVLLVAGLISVVSHTIKARKHSRTITNKSTTSKRLQDTLTFLEQQEISDADTFQDHGSPQYKAARWIADQDGMAMSVEDTNALNEIMQRYVLAVFYYSTSGDLWTKDLRFLSQDHECSWFEPTVDEEGEPYAIGVACDEKLHVESILIPNNNLSGQLPIELAHLVDLTFINLKHNAISGPMPPALFYTSLQKLEYLDLKYNQLTGTIPASISELSASLKVLGLSDNVLRGTFPTELGDLSNLLTLAIDNNELTGDIANVLGVLNHKVEYLYANQNTFTGQLENTFQPADNIVELDLSHNQISSTSFPSQLLERPKLKILDLSNNRLKGTLPQSIPSNVELEFFSLRNNLIDGPISNDISNLESLKHLDLERNQFTGDMPKVIGVLIGLQFLFLGQNEFNEGPIPVEYMELTGLHELSMDATRRTGAIPSWIKNMHELRVLDLASNRLIGNIQADLFDSLVELRFLLLDNNQFNGFVPSEIGGESLSVVSLHRNDFTGDLDGLCGDAETAPLDLLTTDCDEIQCSCCQECCQSDGCYSNVAFENLEHNNASWQDHFQRSDYSFDPKILYSSSSYGDGSK